MPQVVPASFVSMHEVPLMSGALRPNPSLERTRTGMAPWPRARAVYHRPRGQGATPALSAQLKR